MLKKELIEFLSDSYELEDLLKLKKADLETIYKEVVTSQNEIDSNLEAELELEDQKNAQEKDLYIRSSIGFTDGRNRVSIQNKEARLILLDRTYESLRCDVVNHQFVRTSVTTNKEGFISQNPQLDWDTFNTHWGLVVKFAPNMVERLAFGKVILVPEMVRNEQSSGELGTKEYKSGYKSGSQHVQYSANIESFEIVTYSKPIALANLQDIKDKNPEINKRILSQSYPRRLCQVNRVKMSNSNHANFRTTGNNKGTVSPRSSRAWSQDTKTNSCIPSRAAKPDQGLSNTSLLLISSMQSHINSRISLSIDGTRICSVYDDGIEKETLAKIVRDDKGNLCYVPCFNIKDAKLFQIIENYWQNGGYTSKGVGISVRSYAVPFGETLSTLSYEDRLENTTIHKKIKSAHPVSKTVIAEIHKSDRHNRYDTSLKVESTNRYCIYRMDCKKNNQEFMNKQDWLIANPTK